MNYNRKITISGTISSGKTTLCKALLESLNNITFISEHSWDLKHLFPNIDWRKQEVRDYLLISQIVREAQYKDSPFIICDTDVIVSLAHSYVFGVKMREDLLVELNHGRYDAIFVCDYKEVPLEDNQIRDVDPIFRENQHQAILDVASKLGYTPIILTGTVTNRLKIVTEWILTNFPQI